MVFISDSPRTFVAVPRAEVSDILLGGNEVNVPNRQYKALAQRDAFLFDQVSAIISALGSLSPIPGSIKLFGGSGGQGDYNLTSGSDTFADGFYYYNNFTVSAGATLNVSQYARIFCLGNVVINGTVSVSGFSSGGLGFNTGNTSNVGGLSGSGAGAGSGANVGGQTYNYAAAPFGSGGASGFFSAVTGSGTIANGGSGGGGVWFEAAGTVSVGSGATISALGGNGLAGTLISGTADISGGGGGSGGMVLLSSLTSVTVAGTINVRGGNGGAGAAGSARGGGGGGGGQVILIAPTTTTTGATFTLAGGTGGTQIGGGSLGGGAGAGFGGGGGIGSTGSSGAVGRLITRNFRAVG